MVAVTGRPELFALKWPNDVLLSGGKLAGILLEAVNGGALVVGVGVNLATAPEPVDARAGRGAAGVAARGDRPRGDARGLPRPARPGGRRLGGPADRRGLRAAARRLARPRHPARRADRRPAAGPHAERALRDGGRRAARWCSPPRAAASCCRPPTSPSGGPPMLLAIDVGNTNMVFALHDGEKLVAEWRCRTERQRTADEYYVWLRQLMDLNGIPRRGARRRRLVGGAAGRLQPARALGPLLPAPPAGRSASPRCGSARRRASTRRPTSAPTGWSTPSAPSTATAAT